MLGFFYWESEMEIKEFEPRFKSAKIRQNPGLNLVPD